MAAVSGTHRVLKHAIAALSLPAFTSFIMMCSRLVVLPRTLSGRRLLHSFVPVGSEILPRFIKVARAAQSLMS